MRRDSRAGAHVLLGLATTVTSACIDERDRFDVPIVALSLADSIVAPGGDILGRIVASDESGLVRWRVIGMTPIDTLNRSDELRRSDELSDDRRIDVEFSLTVPEETPVGSPIEIIATVFDNQEFIVSKTDTVYVRQP